MISVRAEANNDFSLLVDTDTRLTYKKGVYLLNISVGIITLTEYMLIISFREFNGIYEWDINTFFSTWNILEYKFERRGYDNLDSVFLQYMRNHKIYNILK